MENSNVALTLKDRVESAERSFITFICLLALPMMARSVVSMGIGIAAVMVLALTVSVESFVTRHHHALLYGRFLAKDLANDNVTIGAWVPLSRAHHCIGCDLTE